PGVGSELRRPLGITIVGGLLVSQLLTLFTTPVVYLYMDRLRLWGGRLRFRRKVELLGSSAYARPQMRVSFIRYLVSVARLAPKGRRRKAQGVSPGNKCSKNGSPGGAKQSVPILQRSAYDEYLSVVETDLPAPPFQGSLQIGTLNPGLAPWAVLLDPFGVRCFATETSATRCEQSSQNGQIS